MSTEHAPSAPASSAPEPARFRPVLSRHVYRFYEEMKQHAMELRRQGMSWAQIQKTTSVSQRTIRRSAFPTPSTQATSHQ